MYTGLLHTHRLVVILFLLLYLVKGVLLLLNRDEALARVRKITRIPEMVLSFLFLGTGIAMMFLIAKITPLLIAKIVVVLVSIPIAVVGFRGKNKWLASLSVLLIIGVYGMSEVNKVGVAADPLESGLVTDASAPGYDQLAHGKALFARNCVVCHGENGNLKKSGAKNLQTSQLADAEIEHLILNGKNAMPGYRKVEGYDEDGIDAVIAYVKTFREEQ